MPRFGSGARQMRDVARDLKRAGSPGRGLSRKMRRNIAAAVEPLKRQVQANALAIQTTGSGHTGLRQALANATRVSITPMSKRGAAVRLIVDGKRMPDYQSSLPGYEEGSDGGRALRWRHMVYGNTSVWRPQASHPFVRPAVIRHLPLIDRSVMAAVDETAAQLKGIK